MEEKPLKTPEENAATVLIRSKFGGKEFDAAAAEKKAKAEFEATVKDAIKRAKEDEDRKFALRVLIFFSVIFVVSVSLLVCRLYDRVGYYLLWAFAAVTAVGDVVAIIVLWISNSQGKNAVKAATDAAQIRLNFQLSALNFVKERPDWLDKAIHEEVIKAFEHLKDADLRYPVVEDAVMAARCADVEALLTMKKNGFTKWDDPEIMLAACQTPFPVNVRTVHELGGDVNAEDRDGRTALMYAADHDNPETVKYLVSQGADVNAKDRDGRTALMYAADHDNPETVKYLVSQGADVNAEDRDGRTALMCAAGHDNPEAVKYLLGQGADVNAKDRDGWTALIYAVTNGDLEAVIYLVDQGADVNAKVRDIESDYGRIENIDAAVLMFAVWSRNLEMVKYLVRQGADINVKDRDGMTVLMSTFEDSRWWSVNPIGDLETIKYLVRQGADVNAKDRGGRTVLMFAARAGNVETVKYLVSQGADVNAESEEVDPCIAAKTVLMSAVWSGDLETVKYLVSQGADVNAKDKDGKTALNHAKKECKAYLRSVGAR